MISQMMMMVMMADDDGSRVNVLTNKQTHPQTDTTENNTTLLRYCYAGGNYRFHTIGYVLFNI